MPRKIMLVFFLYLSSVMPKWLYSNLIVDINRGGMTSTGRKTTIIALKYQNMIYRWMAFC